MDATTTFEQRLPELIDQLTELGWAVIDDFLPPATIVALRDEGTRRLALGEFHAAGVGRASGHAIKPSVRGDAVKWLEPTSTHAAEQAYWQQIAALQEALNQSLYLGIREGEFHYAHYPVGSRYQRHIDRFRDDDARVVSAICYLNPDWQAGNGGELRLWLDPDGQKDYQDILPMGGRLVIFLSARFWHAVLPAKQARWSLTGWMRQSTANGLSSRPIVT